MRLPLTRKVIRSYSGEYENANNTSSDESAAQQHGRSVEQPIRRSTKKRKRREEGRPNLLLAFLGTGLFFCLVDVVYISRYLANQSKREFIGNDPHGATVRTLPAQQRQSIVLLQNREVQTLESVDWRYNAAHPVLDLLHEAVGDVNEKVLQNVPSVKEVQGLYGHQPVVLGLETCEAFRDRGDASMHFLSVAGTFNTGTNLLAELMVANCQMSERMRVHKQAGIRWQVLWGKHTPVFNETYRITHRTYNDTSLSPENIFPVVTVRDPYKWMQSMCRHSYGANWPHDKAHCPNLIPNDVDRALLAKRKHQSLQSTVNVTVQYADFAQHHESLVGFWNDWYIPYVQAPFPRLIVRLEDLVFHPKTVVRTACECAGGQMKEGPFKYVVASAKKGAAHGSDKTGYVDALIKYGSEASRYTDYEVADLEYVERSLDKNLMRLFGYRLPKK